MAEIKIRIPDELKEIIERDSMDWGRIARMAILQKAKEIEFMKNFSSESEFDEKDVLKLGEKVNKEVSKKYEGS